MTNGGLLEKKTGPQIEVDSSIVKIIILAIIGIALSFFFGYFLKTFIIQEEKTFLFYSLLCIWGFLAFFLLQVFFVKKALIINLIVLLETAGFLAPFHDGLSNPILIGALVAFLVFLSGVYVGRSELGNMLRIKFWRISKKVLPKVIAGLALIGSIIYAGFNAPEIKEFLITPATFEKVIAPISRIGIFNRLIPEFDLSLPIGTLITNLAEKQIEANPEINALPDMIKKTLIDKSMGEIEEKLSGFVGTPVSLEEKASDVLYKLVVEKFGAIPENVRSFAPIVVGIIIFLTLMGLSWPIRMAATILAFLIYETFLVLGFSAILMESQSKEIVVLK